MNQSESERFKHFYDQQQKKTLKLQGMPESTISSYSRTIGRVDRRPDKLELWQIQDYLAGLVDSRSRGTLMGDDFLKLMLQHVLPKGFRRVRDYGFLHSNAKKLLFLVQLILNVRITKTGPRSKPAFKCPCCKSDMLVLFFRLQPG